MWYTNKKAQVYWPGIFQCCHWKTFKVNNSFILQGVVIKDHDHRMHSDLGDWRHCAYDKGSCKMPDGAQAIWTVNTKERCRYIKYMKVTGQLWGNSFMTHDQTLALTFVEQTRVRDCENRTLRVAQQGVAFHILDNIQQVDYRKLKSLHSRMKREINAEIRTHGNETIKLQIFNVSTARVTMGVVYPLVKFNDTERRQFYVLKMNLYNGSTGKYIDEMYMPKTKLAYKMYTMRVGFLHRKTYGPVFTVLKLKNHVICSFVVLQVQYQTSHSKMRVRRQTEQTDNLQTDNSLLTAQLQATIRFTESTHYIVHAMQ